MTIILIALWIAGFLFHWWWLAVAFAFDVVWTLIKLNFMAVLVRRSIEDTFASIAASIATPPDEPPAAG